MIEGRLALHDHRSGKEGSSLLCRTLPENRNGILRASLPAPISNNTGGSPCERYGKAQSVLAW